MKWRSREEWIVGVAIVVSGLILFFNLWARSLENHDYLRYAEVAREMIRSGEWVVSRLNGEIFIDKPPLLFWLIGIPSSLFGSVTPLIARLPSFLSAWIGIVVLFLWGKRVYKTTESGLIAGGILLSSYQYFFQARIAKTDMLLCLLILLSLYFFYLGYEESRKRRYPLYVLSFFLMGLGILAKGPFGLFPPFIIILVFLIKEGRWKILIGKEFILGYIVLGMTILPWVLLFIHRVGLDQTIALVKENQILTRKAPIYFYLIEIWPQFSPWSLLLPFLAIGIWRRRGGVWHSRESFFLIWFVVFFVILTLFKFRASRYLLPALPPLALMMGGMWKKKMALFLIPLLVFVLAWHSVELYRASRNAFSSPGFVFAKELGPSVRGSELFSYRLDIRILEKINFYLDPIKPILALKDVENVSDLVRKDGRKSILMPKEAYEEDRLQKRLNFHSSQVFHYKGERLVLIICD